MLSRRFLLAAALMVAQSSWAHLSETVLPLQLAVTQWASAAQSTDREALDQLTTEDFVYLGRPKSAYLATLDMVQINRVDLKYATYSVDDDTAKVSPVVYIPYREMDNAFALTLTLARRDGRWKITGAEPAPLPDDWPIPNHMLHHVVYEASVSLRDKHTREPVHARVSVRDQNGEYWPPQGHRKRIALGWRADVGGAVNVAGQTWAYVKPDFKLSLPAGTYTMEVRRGLEYMPVETSFEVTEEGAVAEVTLERWVHMKERGWYSGDTHTHFLDPHFGMLEAQGEDVNVINVLASSGGNLSTQLAHFTGGPSVLSTENHIIYISEETRHDYLGHTVLMNLKEFIFPFGWGGPLTGVHGGYDWPTMAHQADRAHAQGALVAWAHLPHPHAELPIDVAHGKIDAVETFVFGNPFEGHPIRVDMGPFTPQRMSPIELWYALLNTGYNIPAVGGTDKMWNTQVSGAVRTYVDIEGDFTYDSWVDGIRRGRNFVSTGAMLDFTIDDLGPGHVIQAESPRKVAVEVTAESLLPVERIEVVMNGEVVLTRENPEGARKVSLRGDLMVDESAWIAARAYADTILPTQRELTGSGSIVMAHSSPVYVDLGQPRRSAPDAEFLLSICETTVEWAKTRARYHDDDQRQEVAEFYERGCEPFAEQASAQ